MPLSVVYDACILYPAPLRDLLLRLAVEELCRAMWSDEILDEVFDNLQVSRPDLDPAKLSRTRKKMCRAVPGCLITGHLHLVESLDPTRKTARSMSAWVTGGASSGSMKSDVSEVEVLLILDSHAGLTAISVS